MTELTSANVADLTGPALRWAVAQVEGIPVELAEPCYGTNWRVFMPGRGFAYRPDIDWAQGGPLLEKFLVTFGVVCSRSRDERGERSIRAHGYRLGPEGLAVLSRMASGPTILVAACRAIVAAKLGDTVQVPKELMP